MRVVPILPAQAENTEIDIRARDVAAKRAEKNSNKCTDPRERAKFKPRQRVSVQDPISKKWSTTAIVLEEREHGNSYVLATEGIYKGTTTPETSFSSKTHTSEHSAKRVTYSLLSTSHKSKD